jgi:hypothetical protein
LPIGVGVKVVEGVSEIVGVGVGGRVPVAVAVGVSVGRGVDVSVGVHVTGRLIARETVLTTGRGAAVGSTASVGSTATSGLLWHALRRINKKIKMIRIGGLRPCFALF